MSSSELEAPKPRGRLWGIWATIGFGLVIISADMLIQTAVAIIYYYAKTASDPDIDKSLFIDNLDSDGLYLSIAAITSAIAGIGLIILFIKLRKGRTVTEYLGLKRITGKDILAMVGIFMGLLILAAITSAFIEESQDSDFTIEVYNTSIWPVLFGIAVVLFAPAFEEAFFRGFLFAGLRQYPIGDTGAIVLTAVMWAMLHVQYEIYGMLVILVLGIVLGIVRSKTGSLWNVIIIHSLWNLFAVVGAASSQ